MVGCNVSNHVFLLVRAGFGVEARLARQKEKGMWTHAGILVDDVVFECVPDTEQGVGGAVRSREADFANPLRASQAGRVVVSLESARAKSLMDWCETRVNAGLPFDNTYDLSTDDAMYCTEFVLKAFRSIGMDLLSGPLAEVRIPFSGVRNVIFPSDLIGDREMVFI
ncbi:MAG: hypothetical protein ACYCS8_05245 [Acidithiobacillus sp.]